MGDFVDERLRTVDCEPGVDAHRVPDEPKEPWVTLDILGLSVEVLSGPTPGVDEPVKRGGPYGTSDAWPHIAYVVRVKHGDSVVLETPYKLGIGHVKVEESRKLWWGKSTTLTIEEERLLYTWIGKPGARFKDKALWASVAAKLARVQNVALTREDVVWSLLSDGDAYFDDSDFAEWCANLGYDEDSRRAESIYNACIETGRKIVRAVGRENVDALREAFQDY